jgi:hypothetical protein
MTDQRIPKIGDAVRIVTADYVETFGLVTAVHGSGYERGDDWIPPLVNVVYVSPDASKGDSYGRQIERNMTSVNHKINTQGMPKAGYYYDFI